MVNPFFSIIIPTYNSSETLSECIDSIINQDFQNFEVIFIDGLSTDNTMVLINHFADIYNNIRSIAEKDKGIYDAMNKGIKLAKGDWLYFLGSDDKLHSNDVLDKIAGTIHNEKGVDVIYGNVTSSRFGGAYAGEFTTEKLLGQNLCHQAIFFRNAVFKKLGNFDTRYASHADWDHNLRWFLSGIIRKKYVDLVIADYADGGYSSQNRDLLFEKDIRFKYLLYAHSSLSFGRKYLLLKNEVKDALQHRSYRKLVAVLFHSPVILFS